ncbi:hypothetical protein COCOBI_11-1310 [Coccomyxa sp. Obi]|nr:hypothetical protein COCOBI_11-1310 [Coccomyxa sp. Obi]
MQGIGGQQNYLGQYGGPYPPPQSYYVPPGGYPAPGYGAGYPYSTPQDYPLPQSSHGLGKELAAAALGAMGGAALGTVLEEHHHHHHDDDDGNNGRNGDGNG